MVRIFLAALAAALIHASPTDVGAPLARDSLAQDAARILDDDVAPSLVSVPGVVDIDKELERCRAEGYSNLNAYMASDDSTVDPELLRHCNEVKYRDALRTSVAAPLLSARHVHFWHATNDTTYQDVFEKHILASHPIRLVETLVVPPALLTACFGTRSALQTPDAACTDALASFRVPQVVVNDYMQRVESIKETLLPDMVAATDGPLHCPFGLHMVLAAVTDTTTVSLQVHVPSYDEYTFALDMSATDETEVLEATIDAHGSIDADTGVRLLHGDMAFIPSGFAVSASSPMLRFCFADASNLNRVKQHLRVSGLVDTTARQLLLALQAPTFDTSMTRRPSLSLGTWAMYRTWPKPERIAKESDQDKLEAVSRKDRYKMWQDDRKWDSVIQGLTLPVSRPPVVLQDSDTGRTVVHLTWQDLHQPRKGDVTTYGYEIHWATDAAIPNASSGIANLTQADLLRSALPTTAFGGDFDGRAITGRVPNLAANTSYTFAVRLFVGNALGLLSERSQNIRTKPASVPAPVPGLPEAVASDAPNCVQLTWLPVVDDGGRPILGYAIAARHAPTTNASVPLRWRPFNDSMQYDVVTNDALVVTKHELSLRVKNMTGHICNLRATSSYQFQVAAINELGASGFSVWSDTVELEPSSSQDRREVVRGQGAPHFTRTYDRDSLQIGATVAPLATGPVLVFSDVLQTVSPYQLVGLANPVRKLDAKNKVIWSTWRADVWSGQHSLKAYDIIAEAVLADPILGNAPLSNADAVRDRILLVHRGVVPFYTKVAHAQAAGALGVLIFDVDNQCASGFDQHCSPGSHYASGDGVGAKDDPLLWTRNIRIPYALVKYDDALPLLEQIADTHTTADI
ncbi:hypothetical protein SDRG_00716 [Saprolegnia diclina VS20]|uniref:Fibronectin type-III domain-containing protein n=1 Tax=Saprolegnia diclina (strain VS20) TaxID=1156394 RepID=T0R601_SAPDV|nr:hypothetical protein SDRG_00716 [Saprolegnia diclina VS20]EQC41860.1 hypothetical protein SDRG_00716 [Saprolegnia diclina VS20]|eukprot:XP_008604429.1 hypothetical protein SDRG_00716 [Saprolegnia diclina VS20]